MITILKMAFRDLGRNRRRSFFSALALGIGVALLMLMAAVIQGEMRGSMQTSIRLQSGHLQVRASSYDENRTSLAYQDLIANPDQLAAQIASLAPVQVATPRLFASGIVNFGNQSLGVRIIGIEPDSAANAPFREGLITGSFIQADDREGILIGQTLADKLGVKEGQQVNLVANTSNGEVDGQVFTVRGVYTTHTPGFDESAVFMPMAKAQALTQTENHASTIFILLKDQDQLGAVVSALKTNQYQVLTYLEMNKLLSDFEQMARGYMVLIYLIVLGITAAVIINTLIMAVFERTREIGILSAIGMKGTSIMAMFFAESTFLAFGGIAIGILLGGIMVALATKYGFFIGNFGISGIMLGERIYAYPNYSDFVNLTITAFIISLLAALYPALLAANMEPVEAMHGGKQA
jgi:ABC-type lipoprotein release transport system permease subunit